MSRVRTGIKIAKGKCAKPVDDGSLFGKRMSERIGEYNNS